VSWRVPIAYIEPGRTVRIEFGWDSYRGVQVVQAKPEIWGYGGGILIDGRGSLAVTSQGLEREPGGRYWYSVEVEARPESDWYQGRLIGQRVD
jgi:hypothetical protein